jgi:hypothetical protein
VLRTPEGLYENTDPTSHSYDFFTEWLRLGLHDHQTEDFVRMPTRLCRLVHCHYDVPSVTEFECWNSRLLKAGRDLRIHTLQLTALSVVSLSGNIMYNCQNKKHISKVARAALD